MDEEVELLNLNYPLHTSQQIRLETQIKQHLRDNALNIPEENDVKRYSDRYASGISSEDILQSISLEVLSPELQRMYGFASANETVAMLDEADEEDHPCVFSVECNEEESLAGGDDYNYYEGDDLVDEHNDDGNEEVI